MPRSATVPNPPPDVCHPTAPLQRIDVARRPDAQKGPPDDVLVGHRPEESRVGGGVPVVAHHEVARIAERASPGFARLVDAPFVPDIFADRVVGARRLQQRVVRLEIWLLQAGRIGGCLAGAPDPQPSIASDFDRLTGKSDRPLDQIVGVAGCSLESLEHHQVTAFDLAANR